MTDTADVFNMLAAVADRCPGRWLTQTTDHMTALQLRAERAEAALAELRQAAQSMVNWKEPIQLLAPELGGALKAIYRLESLLPQPSGDAAPEQETSHD